jgi:hypothetical protein
VRPEDEFEKVKGGGIAKIKVQTLKKNSSSNVDTAQNKVYHKQCMPLTYSLISNSFRIVWFKIQRTTLFLVSVFAPQRATLFTCSVIYIVRGKAYLRLQVSEKRLNFC